jgi:predicted N-acetyltransferase YhbS
LNIQYKLNPKLTADEFIDILNRSTLGERRPIDDKECIDGMIENADIIVVAIDNDKIVGVARAVTDYNYCCYLSDLAVEQKYQKNGIGKQLISKVQEQLNDKCKIILLSAPDATEYYPKIGFTKHSSAWTLTRNSEVLRVTKELKE